MKTTDSQAGKAANQKEAQRVTRHHLTVNAPIEAAEEGEPDSHLKRIFVVLLLVHVFLVGGIVLYNCLKQPARSQVAENSAQPKQPVIARKLTTGADASAARPVAIASVGDEEYVIKVGDTLKGIAAAHKLEVAEVCSINGISPSDPLEPGTALHLPKKVAPAPEKKPEPQVAAAPAIKATPVRAEDQAGAQAKLVKQEVSPDATPSGPKTTVLSAPPAPTNADNPPAPKKNEQTTAGSTTSKPQDKPADKPAEKPQPKVAQNAKDEAKPKDEPKPKPAPKDDATKPAKDAGPMRSYAVQPKDTFYSIAKKMNVSVEDLMKANNVKDPSKLHEGIKLKVPAAKKP
jgi:LysM repeat protein